MVAIAAVPYKIDQPQSAGGIIQRGRACLPLRGTTRI
jgi:hypothetical protein